MKTKYLVQAKQFDDSKFGDFYITNLDRKQNSAIVHLGSGLKSTMRITDLLEQIPLDLIDKHEKLWVRLCKQI